LCEEGGGRVPKRGKRPKLHTWEYTEKEAIELRVRKRQGTGKELRGKNVAKGKGDVLLTKRLFQKRKTGGEGGVGC